MRQVRVGGTADEVTLHEVLIHELEVELGWQERHGLLVEESYG